jgi:hypothetical protein
MNLTKLGYTEDNPINIGVHADMGHARVAMKTHGFKPVVMLIIYEFQPIDDPYTHIICGDEKSLAVMREVFPEAVLCSRTPEQTDYVLYLAGDGKTNRDRLWEAMPLDDSWGYLDYRY